MNLTFGAARPLYRKRIHPRLLLGPEDMAALRGAVKKGNGLRIMRAMRRKADVLFAELAATADWPKMLEGDGGWSSLSARLRFAVGDLAAVAALDERDDYTVCLERLMTAVIEKESARERGSRASVGSADFAIPFDLLDGRWSVEARRLYSTGGAAIACRTLERLGMRFFLNAGGNIPLVLLLGALRTALAVRGEPGVGPGLESALRDMIERFDAAVQVTANESGYPEEDVGYGTSVMGRLVEAGEMLHRAGLFDAYRASPAFANSGRAILHFVQPWGENLSNTGDHGDDFGNRELALARLAARTRDPRLVWLLRTLSYTHGVVHPENNLPLYREVPLPGGGQAPASFESLLVLKELDRARHPARVRTPTAFCDRRRGIVSFRSGWEPDAVFVVFDGSQRSPAAQGHAHASCGHFSLSAQGEYFSIDTGRYANEQDQHSVTLVDGRSGRSMNGEWIATKWPGRLTACEPGAFVDYAAVDSSHPHNAYWARRHLGLVKGKRPYVWITDDINARDDWATYHWLMQTSPENRIAIADGRATVTGWRHGNMLDVHAILPAPGDFPRPHEWVWTQDEAGPSAWKYLKVPEAMPDRVTALQANVARYPRPASLVHGPVYVRPRLVGQAGGYNGRFLTLLIPRRKGEKPAVVERLPGLPNVLAARIVFPDGTEDRVALAFEHRLLRAEGLNLRGSFAVIRADRAGRRTCWVRP